MFRLTADIRCMNCSYLLHGLDSNRCPECGHPFDRKNPETYADYVLNGKYYLLTACFGPFFMALPFVAWFAVDWLAGRLDAAAYFQSGTVLTAKVVTG